MNADQRMIDAIGAQMKIINEATAEIERLLKPLFPAPPASHLFLYPLADWPVTIISRFGDHRTKPFVFDHEGVDFSVPVGHAVHAMYDGTVYDAQLGRDYGLRIWVQSMVDDRIVEHCYAHLSKLLVKKSDAVKRDQVIGLSGGDPKAGAISGNSTGPHLHVTILDSNSDFLPKGCGLALRGAVDPLLWIAI